MRANDHQTLAPYLSLRNFEVSVAARLNADKTQTNETVYNPDQKAQRSRTSDQGEADLAEHRRGARRRRAGQPAQTAKLGRRHQTIQRFHRQEGGADQLRDLLEVGDHGQRGLHRQGLSVAVLINRAALAAALGDKPMPEAIDKQVKEIEQLVVRAAGLTQARGDTIKISVVDFADASKDLEPVAGPSLLEMLERQTGTLISAAAILAVGALLILFGVRPLTQALLAAPAESTAAAEAPPAALEAPAFEMRNAWGDDSPGAAAFAGMGADDNLLLNSGDSRDAYSRCVARTARKRPATATAEARGLRRGTRRTPFSRQWIRQGAGA